MKNKSNINDNMTAELVAQNSMADGINVRTKWTTECYGADGTLKWIEQDRPNVCTTEGINHMLDVEFHGVAAKGTWYVALFESNSTPAITDTYDLWADSLVTESTAYTSATRVEYNEAAASAKVMTNTANKASFTINDTKTLYGAALVSNSTKSHHAAGDFVFCSSTFASPRAVVDTDVLRVTITITGADT